MIRFNPRSHAGSDHQPGLKFLFNQVSIHAPTQGATKIHFLISVSLKEFQSTLPRRERPQFQPKISSDFQQKSTNYHFKYLIFPFFHPLFVYTRRHLCTFKSANPPAFSCLLLIRTLILSQNQRIIYCNSTVNTHMFHFCLILIAQIIESQAVNAFINNICQYCLQGNTLRIIQNAFENRILHSSAIIRALLCNFPQSLPSRGSLSIHIICDQYKHHDTSLPQKYRITVQISS